MWRTELRDDLLAEIITWFAWSVSHGVKSFTEAIISEMNAGKDDVLSHALYFIIIIIIIIHCLLSDLSCFCPYAKCDISAKPRHLLPRNIYVFFFSASVLFPFHLWSNPETYSRNSSRSLLFVKTRISWRYCLLGGFSLKFHSVVFVLHR